MARSPRGGAWTRARRRPRASPRAASPPVFSPFEPSDPAAIPAPQDLAYASLAAAYGLVALVALAQLARIHARVPEYGCVPSPPQVQFKSTERQTSLRPDGFLNSPLGAFRRATCCFANTRVLPSDVETPQRLTPLLQ